MSNKELINQLVYHEIPKLPCELRMIFLMRHESVFWEKKKPLQWQHLADFHKMSLDEINETFMRARNKLIRNATQSQEIQKLDCIEMSVFMIWTQSQRVEKRKKFTDAYFADLLNMPVNTYKTKYRKSIEILAKALGIKK